MSLSKFTRFARQNAIALTALFIALGGTGYAAVAINGANIKNGSITAKKLKKHTLTGTQINLKKLGTVVAASRAANAQYAVNAGTATQADDANTLGGVAAGGYLRSGCGTGKVEAYATIAGRTSTPSTFSSSSTYLHNAYDCSGQQIEIRRISTGVYDVSVPGVTSQVAFANVVVCPLGTGVLCLAYPTYTVTASPISFGPDAGDYQIQINNSTDGDPEDATVDLLLP